MTERDQTEPPGQAPGSRSCLVPILILVLGSLEDLILYLLIAVNSPVAPAIRRAIQNPFGLFAVVMSVVTFLSLGVAAVLSWVERRATRRDRDERPS